MHTNTQLVDMATVPILFTFEQGAVATAIEVLAFPPDSLTSLLCSTNEAWLTLTVLPTASTCKLASPPGPLATSKPQQNLARDSCYVYSMVSKQQTLHRKWVLFTVLCTLFISVHVHAQNKIVRCYSNHPLTCQ